MACDRHGPAVARLGDALEATRAADGRLRQRFFARWDVVLVCPRLLLERGIFRLRDSGFVGGPLLEAGSLRNGEPKRVREDDRALDAAPQGAREDDGRAASGPCAGKASDLFLSASGEGRAVKVRRVGRPDNLAVAYEDQNRGHPSAPPETTPITRIRSPSCSAVSAGIGASPRMRICASGARRRACNRSRPLAAEPSSTDASLRPGWISAVTCIVPSRTLPDLSVLPRQRTSEHLSETSVSGCFAAQVA